MSRSDSAPGGPLGRPGRAVELSAGPRKSMVCGDRLATRGRLRRRFPGHDLETGVRYFYLITVTTGRARPDPPAGRKLYGEGRTVTGLRSPGRLVAAPDRPCSSPRSLPRGCRWPAAAIRATCAGSPPTLGRRYPCSDLGILQGPNRSTSSRSEIPSFAEGLREVREITMALMRPAPIALLVTLQFAGEASAVQQPSSPMPPAAPAREYPLNCRGGDRLVFDTLAPPPRPESSGPVLGFPPGPGRRRPGGPGTAAEHLCLGRSPAE